MERFLVRTNKATDAPPAAKKLRRYDEAYLQFGFTVTADLRSQCVVCAESPYYALQLDESTDIAGQAHLLTYVRHLRDKAIEEDVLFCRPLHSHTTGEAIFNVLDIFIRENGLAWDRCVGLCTDGARAMTGRERGLVWEKFTSYLLYI
ncbi:Zinc finger BED domain-containing protein 5 [Merluccius polli]|uniref:Zinc finger BED domain-containing protein 5 n=1 Tax=Merluccius polli TaxID=89951 RepID=A0AA47P2R0_MERPO|nr:Zinc finger BED domain-containing protein 5 [Merluccius polli]